MRQRVVGHQHVALGGESEFGDGAVADAQVQLNGGFGRGAQDVADSG